ncbi:zinc finger protein [Penicillium canescens]|nr:zinc finger protein [Penicillium canescens]
MRTKHNLTLKYMANVVDFGEHTGSTATNRIWLPSHVTYFRRAVIPPDIRTYRAFLEWVARGMDGRIEERPTVETI